MTSFLLYGGWLIIGCCFIYALFVISMFLALSDILKIVSDDIFKVVLSKKYEKDKKVILKKIDEKRVFITRKLNIIILRNLANLDGKKMLELFFIISELLDIDSDDIKILRKTIKYLVVSDKLEVLAIINERVILRFCRKYFE